MLAEGPIWCELCRSPKASVPGEPSRVVQRMWAVGRTAVVLGVVSMRHSEDSIIRGTSRRGLALSNCRSFRSGVHERFDLRLGGPRRALALALAGWSSLGAWRLGLIVERWVVVHRNTRHCGQ